VVAKPVAVTRKEQAVVSVTTRRSNNKLPLLMPVAVALMMTIFHSEGFSA
jgi:hypothetical protein